VQSHPVYISHKINMEKEKFEQSKKQTYDIEIIPLSDEKSIEVHTEPGSQKIKEYLIKNKNEEIIKFADLNFNENLFETIKQSCLEKGIVLKDDEIEKLAEKTADAMLVEIDENESTEN